MFDVPHERSDGTDSSAELLARIASGDARSEEEFVRRFEAHVRTLVRRHCRPNDPDVSDIVQEVLTSVLERLRDGAILSAHALPSYLRTTVVRTATAEYRRRPLRPQADTDAVETTVDETQDVADDIDRQQRNRLVRQLIAELPTHRDREIIRRFCIEEDSKEEVCRALGIDPSHFHRVTFRARQRLGELLRANGIHSTSGETTRQQGTPA